MAGNGEERRGGAAVHAAWVDSCLAELRDMVSAQFAYVRTITLPADDLIAADRKTRAITNLARSVAAVEAAARRRLAADAADDPEDEMNGSDRPDPETTARYRAELVRRMDRLRAIVESKRMAVDPRDRSRMEGSDEGDTGSGIASGGAARTLEDMGDAGWPGVRQDLCGGALAP